MTIVARSGARYTSTVDAPRGSGPRGIEWSDVEAKYRALLPDSRLPVKRIEETIDRIAQGQSAVQAAETDDDGLAKEFRVVESKLNLLGQQFQGARADATTMHPFTGIQVTAKGVDHLVSYVDIVRSVVGTDVAYQPVTSNRVVEIESPGAETLAELWIRQPFARVAREERASVAWPRAVTAVTSEIRAARKRRASRGRIVIVCTG